MCKKIIFPYDAKDLKINWMRYQFVSVWAINAQIGNSFLWRQYRLQRLGFIKNLPIQIVKDS